MLGRGLIVLVAGAVSGPLMALQARYAQTYDLTYRIAPAPASESALHMLGMRHLQERQRPTDVKHPTYNAKEPVFFQVPAPGAAEARWAALDSAEPESSLPDRLYFDADGDQDLTDEKPMSARTLPTEEETAYRQALFPSISVGATIEGKKQPYDVAIGITYWAGEDVASEAPGEWAVSSLFMTGAGYYEGRVELGDKAVRLAVVDLDMDGRFDERTMLQESGPDSDAVAGPIIGDGLIMSERPDEPIAPTEIDYLRFNLLGRYVSFEGDCYQIRVAPDGSSVKVYNYKPEVGILRTSHANALVQLVDKDGALAVRTGPEGARVPVGTYLPIYNMLHTTDADGRQWLLMCEPAELGQTIEIKANEPLEIAFGPPLEWTLSTEQVGAIYSPGPGGAETEQFVSLSLSLTGRGNGSVGGMFVDGEQPPAPQFRIVNEAGEVVHEGQFEFG